MFKFAIISASSVKAAEVRACELFQLPRTPRPLVNDNMGEGNMYRLSWPGGQVAEVYTVFHGFTEVEAAA